MNVSAKLKADKIDTITDLREALGSRSMYKDYPELYHILCSGLESDKFCPKRRPQNPTPLPELCNGYYEAHIRRCYVHVLLVSFCSN